MVTIRDVAKLAGVSVATVSNAVNDPNRVSDELRERVLKAIARLNYAPVLPPAACANSRAA